MGEPAHPQRPLALVLSALLTLALALIVDLDRPWSGAVTVSQQPMLDLRAGIQD